MASEANTVTLSTNLNVSPYYDDFDETKNYHRILFRPGLAVQARELTQMQSIQQNQIDRFAEHIFKEGSKVRGCEGEYDQKYFYVKLRNNTSTGGTVTVSSLVGKTLKGTTSGVRAIVLNATDGAEANTPNFKTIFVKYTAANTNGTRYFANNEILTAVDGSGLSANTIRANQGGAGGYGSAYTIASGIVYAKDHFIRVNEQTLILEKYNTTPSYRVGLNVVESIINSDSDDTLLDPAAGAYNYAAPGADRLVLTPTLAKYSFTDTSANNFIELLQIKNGIVQSIAETTEYSKIRDYMANRTADESGDYIVNGLQSILREHLDTGSNRGAFTTGNGGDSNKLYVEVSPGKAYIQGYDLKTIISKGVAIDKGIDYASVADVSAIADYGNYVLCDNVAGLWDLNGQDRVSLYSAQQNAVSSMNYSLTAASGSAIGTAVVRAIVHHSGTPGLPNCIYKVYLADIRITTGGKSFANTQSIVFSSATANGKADIVGTSANGSTASTFDTSYERGVFLTPASNVKRLRDTSGNVNTDWQFIKTFDVSFNNLGMGTVTTGDASERFSGSGVQSDAIATSDYIVVSKTSANTATLTGTASISSGANTITGSGTAFTTQVNAGDMIAFGGGGAFETYLISEVVSDTSMKTLGNAAATKTSRSLFKHIHPGMIFNMAGVGRDGNRSINVTSSTGITIDLNETFNSPATITGQVVTKLNKSNGQEAAKVINRDRLVQIHVGAGGGTSYVANTTGPWPLGLSDGFRLVSVRQKSGSNFASTGEGTDVTTHFTLSSGMHDSLYEHAKLVKKSGSSLAIANGDRLLVKFDYFTHSYSSGVGYFSVDSYPVNDATAGSDTSKIYTYQIPVYVSPETGTAIDLRNSIDVRPRMTDTANTVTTLTNISINPKLSTSTDEPSGGLRFPYPGENFSMDLDYYLARKDLITMDVNGRINSVRGTPNIKPAAPEVPKTTMDLATVLVSPYPSLPISVAIAAGRQSMACGVFPARHERYTMRDIGAIKDRVDHLEYYTSLNMLEKNANDLSIQDENGLDRFKNGMLVDAFTGHGIGNVHDLDYKISIDSKKGEMRPPFKLDSLTLEYDSSSSDVVRTNVTVDGISKDQTVAISNSQIMFTAGETLTSGAFTATLRHQTDGRLYIENATGNFVASASVSGGTSGSTATISTVVTTPIGELITLPYSHEILVNQPYATTTRVVAGASWKFVGLLTLDPDNDFWVDTTQKPDVNINFDLNVDAWMHVASSWQTAWGNWQDVIGGRQETVIGQRLVSQGQSILGNDIIQTDLVQDVIAVSTQQSRAGVQPTLVPYTQTQRIGNRITDINIQPYMRSRSVRFTARGMKPSSRLYAFFDGKNVGSYVTPTNSSFANTANESGRLTSDTSGNVYGIFRIPADDSLRFYTGAKIFRLTDNPTNVDGLGLTTTGAEAIYTASGLNTQQQDAVITTRGVQFTNADVHESQVVGSTEFASRGLQQTVVGQVPQATGGGQPVGEDPIAQSFLVTPIQVSGVSGSGMFVTKIDLYFSRKDSTYPVTVELREIINGAMTGNLVPFSRVTISSADVNVSDDGSAATPFYFSAPVYLLADKEYGFIVIPGAASPEYAVYTARLGDIDITTGNRIVSQPATGVLYVSSNDTAFSAIQEEDIKYTLYYAKFTKTVGTAVLKNEARDYMTLSNVSSTFTKMGETIHGETLLFGTFANTKAVNAHVTYVQGMVSGATGRIRSYTPGASGNIKVYSVSDTKFKGGERIRIRNTNATTGVIVGNSTGGIVSASYPIGTMEYYDAVNFANTRVHLTNVSYANSGSTTLNRTFIPNMYITGQTDGYYAKIMTMDKLQLDVANLRGDVLLPSNTSLAYAGKFATSDSTRDSSYIGLNLNDDMEFTAPRFVLSRSVESNTSASSATMAANKSAEVKITLTSNTIIGSPVVDTRRISLITVQNLINSNVAIASSEDGVLSGGNALARYITRKVTLAEGQDAEDVVVYLDGYKPSGSDIVVYYKAIHADDSDGFDNARWIPMSLETATTQVSSSVNTNDFREYKYIVSTYDNVYRSGANTVNSGILEYRNTTNKARFVGYKHLAIKIVLQKDTSTQPPRVRNLRIIALQR